METCRSWSFSTAGGFDLKEIDHFFFFFGGGSIFFFWGGGGVLVSEALLFVSFFFFTVNQKLNRLVLWLASLKHPKAQNFGHKVNPRRAGQTGFTVHFSDHGPFLKPPQRGTAAFGNISPFATRCF